MKIILSKMFTRDRAVYGLNRPEKILYPSAIGNLLFLLFGRVPERLLGISILVFGSVVLISLYNNQAADLESGLPRFEAINLPTFVKTISSSGADKLRAQEAVAAKTPQQPAVVFETVGTPTEYGLPPGIDFKHKIKMFATSYDKTCPGCSGTTASGLPTGYGVVAVDPKVIPLGSQLFIPGYGKAVAGDTGGSIKGAKIDLGFDSIKTGWWSSRFVDVYVLK